MTLVLALWVLAMISGLSWARWYTGLLTGATAAVFLTTQATALGEWSTWFQFGVLVASPWLLAAQRQRDEGRLKTQQQHEARQMADLQEAARSLLSLQMATRRLEGQIAHITDVYHVTKQTSGALHLKELFDASLALAPRLLNANGLRLVDLSAEQPSLLRATRSSNGRLIAEGPAEGTNHLQELEQFIIKQTMSSGQAASAQAAQLSCPLPKGLSRVAWAPLWREQRPIGVLIAENLPDDQVKTLSIVANQLSLQLSRIHFYQQVEAMAVTDALTGLFVRRYFLERLQEELARCTQHGLPCTLLMIDLDHFKQKNDTYGHLVGDVVLKDVAQLLKRNLREIDLIARYGGEEFILLLVETSVEQGVPISERLRQLVEIRPIRAYDELLSQTISIGAAGLPEDAQDLETLIECSDQALYAAKRAGRNRVMRWSRTVAGAQPPHGG